MNVIQVWKSKYGNGFWSPSDKEFVIPKRYEYLPSGDAPLSAAVKRMCRAKKKDLFVVMQKKHRRYPSAVVGLIAPKSIIAAERTRLEAARTPEAKEQQGRQRDRRQERDIVRFAANVIQRFPGCPEAEAREIAERACEIGSGRVGRSTVAEDPVKAAVVAHVRHQHTDYDEILDAEMPDAWDNDERQRIRDDVRESVREKINSILSKWEQAAATSDLQEV